MQFRLLLIDGKGEASTMALRIRTLREFQGLDGLSVHFRPVRKDSLFESAKTGGGLAYRILVGEGVVRAQLWVEYEILDEHPSVMGRSSDLLFALALLTAKWTREGGTACPAATTQYAAIAATGMLDGEGAVHSVEGTAQKIAAALRDLAPDSRAVIFYPAADAATVAERRASIEIPEHIDLKPVAHLEEALEILGYRLDKVYLRNPFRGLEHFEYQHHAIFFGRDREVREAVEQLLRRETAGAPRLLLEGASGSGKSSLLLAGLLPALVERRFQSETVQEIIRRRPFSAAAGRAIWRPGHLTADVDESKLASSIRSCWAALPEFPSGDSPNGAPTLDELAAELRRHWPHNLRFVWVMDQFEELFNLRLDDGLIEIFGRFLARLQSDGAWTLGSVRADASQHLKRHAVLRQVFGANEGQYYLAALSGTAVDDVINLPARAANLTYGRDADGKGLDQMLREDAYQERGSLPQLQFTLNELYQKRAGQELTVAAYRQLGGLSGSIATTAALVLSAEEAGAARALPRLFRSLVSVDDSGHATRRYAPLIDITSDPDQNRFLSRLIETRLCVTDQRVGQAVVAFAHDTLLQTLPALTDWLKDEAGLLQTRELAQREARLWQQHACSDAWLAAADKLVSFKTLEAAAIVLPDAVQSFIQRSSRRVRRNTRIRRAAVSVIALFGVSLIVGAFALLLQQRRADEAREMAARRGDFLGRLLSSANPRPGGDGGRNMTVAQLIDAAGPQIEALVAKEPLVAASMLKIVAETNHGLGRYPEALSASTRAIELLRAHGGANFDLADALTLRGQSLQATNVDNEAESVLREAIALVEHQRGSEKRLALALVTLGAVYQDLGREAESESMYLRALNVSQAGGKPLEATLWEPLTDLGVLRFNQGRYQEALNFQREAVEVARKHLRHDATDLLDTEYNYAVTLEHSHPAAAEPVLRDLLASYTRTLGPNNSSTLMAAQGLAHKLFVQRRYEEAAAIALPAAEGLSRVAGEHHDWSLASWGLYGIAACLAGQVEPGLKALRRVAVLASQQSDVGDRHRRESTDVRIGTCLVAQRRYAEAEPLLLKAAASLESERGSAFLSTQEAYQALHDLDAATGRSAEAAAWQAKIAVVGQ